MSINFFTPSGKRTSISTYLGRNDWPVLMSDHKPAVTFTNNLWRITFEP